MVRRRREIPLNRTRRAPQSIEDKVAIAFAQADQGVAYASVANGRDFYHSAIPTYATLDQQLVQSGALGLLAVPLVVVASALVTAGGATVEGVAVAAVLDQLAA